MTATPRNHTTSSTSTSRCAFYNQNEKNVSQFVLTFANQLDPHITSLDADVRIIVRYNPTRSQWRIKHMCMKILTRVLRVTEQDMEQIV